MENNDQSDSVTGWNYLSVQLFDHQTKCLSSGQFQNSHSVVSVQEPQRKKKQPPGNEDEGGEREDYLAVGEFSYEQEGSSDGVRGQEGGTVLKERKAKMEGS